MRCLGSLLLFLLANSKRTAYTISKGGRSEWLEHRLGHPDRHHPGWVAADFSAIHRNQQAGTLKITHNLEPLRDIENLGAVLLYKGDYEHEQRNFHLNENQEPQPSTASKFAPSGLYHKPNRSLR